MMHFLTQPENHDIITSAVQTRLLTDSQWLPLCGHRSTIRLSVTAPLWTQVYYQTVSDCPFVDTGLSDTDSDCPFVDTGLSDTDSDCPFVDTGLLSDSQWLPLCGHRSIRHRQWLPLCGHRSTIRQSVTAPLWTQVYYQIVGDCPFVDTGLLSDSRWLPLCGHRSTIRQSVTAPLWTQVYYQTQTVTAPLWTQVYYQTQTVTAPLWTQVYDQTVSDCPFVDTGLLSVSDCPFVDTGLSDTDSDCRGLLLHTGRLTAEVCYYTQADGQLTKQSLSIGIRKMTRHFSCFVCQRVGWQNLYKLTHGIASLWLSVIITTETKWQQIKKWKICLWTNKSKQSIWGTVHQSMLKTKVNILTVSVYSLHTFTHVSLRNVTGSYTFRLTSANTHTHMTCTQSHTPVCIHTCTHTHTTCTVTHTCMYVHTHTHTHMYATHMYL